MTDQVQTLELDFYAEPGDAGTDLAGSAAALRDSVAALPGVDGVDAQVAEPVRMIDPVSAAAIVLSVTAAVRNASDLVESLDDLVNDIKQLARDAGLPRLWLWVHRKKVSVDELTADHLREYAKELTSDDG